MSQLVRSCLERYEELCGGDVTWEKVATPFLNESNEPDPSRDPTLAESGLQCPWCKGIYDEKGV